jgi:hypothetical protein
MTDWEAKEAAKGRRKAAGVQYDSREHNTHLYRESEERQSHGFLTDAEIAAAEAECARYELADMYKWQIAFRAWVTAHQDEITAWAKTQDLWSSWPNGVPGNIAWLYIRGGTRIEPRRFEPGYTGAWVTTAS